MKQNILGLILLGLLIVGSSEALAFEAPTLQGDYTPDQRQKVERVQVIFLCAEVYKAYGAMSNYDESVYDIGVTLRSNASTLADHIGMDFLDVMNTEIAAAKEARSMRDQVPVILPNIDNFCSGVYTGAQEAVNRIQ